MHDEKQVLQRWLLIYEVKFKGNEHDRLTKVVKKPKKKAEYGFA